MILKDLYNKKTYPKVKNMKKTLMTVKTALFIVFYINFLQETHFEFIFIFIVIFLFSFRLFLYIVGRYS